MPLFTYTHTTLRALDKQAKSILDIGCGEGGPLRFFSKRRRLYTVGVDVFKPALREAKRQEIYDEYVLCDVRMLPVQRSFDVVLCTELIEHLTKEDAWKLIHEMENIARRQVIITTRVGVWRQDLSLQKGNPYQRHQSVWTPTELKEAGYRVRGEGVRKICDELSILSRNRFLNMMLGRIVLGNPFTVFLPRLAAGMICIKKLGGS